MCLNVCKLSKNWCRKAKVNAGRKVVGNRLVLQGVWNCRRRYVRWLMLVYYFRLYCMIVELGYLRIDKRRSKLNAVSMTWFLNQHEIEWKINGCWINKRGVEVMLNGLMDRNMLRRLGHVERMDNARIVKQICLIRIDENYIVDQRKLVEFRKI